ncbi:YbaK/EbsC family protein [Shewanella abyssi]|uniref:YbaK/EbsC family protein n=1 Tax=Shewanella abyssi TaxID=311789 RepID=UPI00200BCB87|nr:YbaK/EbsC family protein [Shewanella abyssi]MCL1051841.1 YbaK/EbsC family protein [Shewanella abyssi]
MTIQIEQTDMQSVDQLTGKNQLLLTMIPNATPWVKANLANKSNTLSFASEDELIEQLGIGLSGTSIVSLPGANLTLEIKKLMELSVENTLALLSNESSTNTSTSTEISRRYHLISNDKLNKVKQFFDEHKLAVPVGWNMGLNDTIECYQSLTYVDNVLKQKTNIRTAAAQWALMRAQTLAEFGHYYCLYLHFYKYTDGDQSKIDALITLLINVVLNNLDCPLVTYELDPLNLQSAIAQWNKSGCNLGFSSLTSGLLCVGMNINLKDLDRISEEATIYLQQLQPLLSEKMATDSYVNQAGLCRHYIYSLPQRTMMLNVNNIGCLSLYSDLPAG